MRLLADKIARVELSLVMHPVVILPATSSKQRLCSLTSGGLYRAEAIWYPRMAGLDILAMASLDKIGIV